MRAWRSLREPAVAILLLASVAHVVRRDLFDLLLFSGTAVLILVDAGRTGRRPDDGSAADATVGAPQDVDVHRTGGDERSVAHRDTGPDRRLSRRLSVAAGLALFAVLAALPSPASAGAVLVLAFIGLAALVLVLVRSPRGVADTGRAAGKLSGWQVWATIGVAAALWELTSFIAQQVWPTDDEAHPAVSDLVEPLLAGWFGRAVFLLLWAAAGWWLLRLWSGTAPGGERRHGRFTSDHLRDDREVGR